MESSSSDAFRLSLPYIVTIASARDTAEEVHEPLIPQASIPLSDTSPLGKYISMRLRVQGRPAPSPCWCH